MRLLLTALFAFSLLACSKNEDPANAVTTYGPSMITSTSARLGGIITGDATARGVVWGFIPHVTLEANQGSALDGFGPGLFTTDISGLEPNKTYYFRAFANFNNDPIYSEAVSFKTDYENCGYTYIVFDGHPTVVIGNTCWLRSSLSSTFEGFIDYYKTWPGNDYDKYGLYYPPRLVLDTLPMSCGYEWRIATYADWMELANELGGTHVAGGKLKAEGTADWKSPNTNATNESGFSAYPAGYLEYDSTSNQLIAHDIGEAVYFIVADRPYGAMKLSHNSAAIEYVELPGNNIYKSCRCVKK